MLLTISSKYWMATRIMVWRNIISEDRRPHAAESKSHYPRQFLERASNSRKKELLQIFYPWLGYGHKMILIHFISMTVTRINKNGWQGWHWLHKRRSELLLSEWCRMSPSKKEWRSKRLWIWQGSFLLGTVSSITYQNQIKMKGPRQ